MGFGVPPADFICPPMPHPALHCAPSFSSLPPHPLSFPPSFPAPSRFGITNCLDLTYTAFVVAFSLAFNTTQGFEAGWLGITDIIGSIIYMADLFMGFHMGVVASWEGRAVIVQGEWQGCWGRFVFSNGRVIETVAKAGWVAMPALDAHRCCHCTACRRCTADARVAMEFYTKHGTFWADLVATLPLFAQIGIAAAGNDTSAVRIIYMLRLLRLIRWVGARSGHGGWLRQRRLPAKGAALCPSLPHRYTAPLSPPTPASCSFAGWRACCRACRAARWAGRCSLWRRR